MPADTAATAAATAPDLDSLLHDIAALDALFATWSAEQQGAVRAYRTAIEALHREAVRRLIAALKQDPGALARMKEAMGDEVVYGVLRHLGLVRASLQEKIEAALESVRPLLASHGGGVELAGIKPPDTVEVRFLGACDGCSASQLTFAAGVRKAIQERCPEIRHVVEVRGLAAAPGVRYQSPFALAAAAGEGAWLPAAALDQIPLGGILRLSVAGRNLLLSRTADAVTCFTNACAHLATPLDDGEIADGVLTCRRHGFQYLLATGECLTAPAVQLEQHAVRLIDRRVEVRLSR